MPGKANASATCQKHVAYRKRQQSSCRKAERTERLYASAESQIESTASIDWLHVLPIGKGSRAAAPQLSWQLPQRQLGAYTGTSSAPRAKSRQASA